MREFEKSLNILAAVILLAVYVGELNLAMQKLNAIVDNALGVRSGTLIVQALDRYHRDYGQFPREIGLLIPEYLDRLPQPPRNDGFSYDTYHDSPLGDYYILCFPDPRRSNWSKDYGCCYFYPLHHPPSHNPWGC